MDQGAGIYVNLLNSIISHTGRVNPRLSILALNEKAKVLAEAGVGYSIENGFLSMTNAGEQNRSALLDLILAYAGVFEAQYGVNETWMPLKTAVMQNIKTLLDDIRSLELEIPISKYAIEYIIYENLFGFTICEFRGRRWNNGTALVTTRNIVLEWEGNKLTIPFSHVATVDREIYLGYTPETIRGICRAIDYQVKEAGMSCAVFLGTRNLIEDFMKAVSIGRAQERRLSKTENAAIIALYNNTPPKDLPRVLNLKEGDAAKCFLRLIQMGYADQAGHPTSYGINLAVQLMRGQSQG